MKVKRNREKGEMTKRNKVTKTKNSRYKGGRNKK